MRYVVKRSRCLTLEFDDAYTGLCRARITFSQRLQPKREYWMPESERAPLRVFNLLHRQPRFHPEQGPLLPDVPQNFLIHKHRKNKHKVDVAFREISVCPCAAALIVVAEVRNRQVRFSINRIVDIEVVIAKQPCGVTINYAEMPATTAPADPRAHWTSGIDLRLHDREIDRPRHAHEIFRPLQRLRQPPAYVAGIRHRRIATGRQAQLCASDVALRPPAEKPVVMRHTARCRRPAPIRLRLRLHVESQASREKKPVVKINLPLQSGVRLRSSMDE